jgi:uncharacterized protein (TIGR03435 family)
MEWTGIHVHLNAGDSPRAVTQDMTMTVRDHVTVRRSGSALVLKVLVFTVTAATLNGAPDAPTCFAQPRAGEDAGASFEAATVTRSQPLEGNRGGIQLQPDGQFTARSVTLVQLVEAAYKRHAFDRPEVEGGPDWSTVDRFDVSGRAGAEHALDESGFPRRTLMMLRNLLAVRFSLRVRHAERDRPVYALTMVREATLGARLRRSEVNCAEVMRSLRKGQGPDKPRCAIAAYPGRLVASAVTLPDFASVLSGSLDRVVVDRTGLEGNFDLEVEAVEFRPSGPFGPSYRPSDTQQSIFQALPEQLGLRLEPTAGSVGIVVIEHAERSSIK